MRKSKQERTNEKEEMKNFKWEVTNLKYKKEAERIIKKYGKDGTWYKQMRNKKEREL